MVINNAVVKTFTDNVRLLIAFINSSTSCFRKEMILSFPLNNRKFTRCINIIVNEVINILNKNYLFNNFMEGVGT